MKRRTLLSLAVTAPVLGGAALPEPQWTAMSRIELRYLLVDRTTVLIPGLTWAQMDEVRAEFERVLRDPDYSVVLPYKIEFASVQEDSVEVDVARTPSSTLMRLTLLMPSTAALYPPARMTLDPGHPAGLIIRTLGERGWTVVKHLGSQLVPTKSDGVKVRALVTFEHPDPTIEIPSEIRFQEPLEPLYTMDMAGSPIKGEQRVYVEAHFDPSDMKPWGIGGTTLTSVPGLVAKAVDQLEARGPINYDPDKDIEITLHYKDSTLMLDEPLTFKASVIVSGRRWKDMLSRAVDIGRREAVKSISFGPLPMDLAEMRALAQRRDDLWRKKLSRLDKIVVSIPVR